MAQEEILEAPSIDLMSEEVLNYLLGEDIYQGTLSWQGNKVSTKLIMTRQRRKVDGNICSFSFIWTCPVLILPKLRSL